MEKKDFYKWDDHGEDGREVIHEWSRKRNEKLKGFGKSYNKLLIYTFDADTLKSFIKNFNFMVIIQMGLAALSVYLFNRFKISFDFHVSLFVSPIVFPLAFSINTDFQRREKVLEDLANFKAAAMLWFFCMREWKKAAGLDDEFLNAVHNKVKNMMFNLREYLLTDKLERRRFISRCMYEDFSDTNQLIEQVRASKLPANTSIISRVIHLLNMLCLSFEKLRVIREYRSPRSIRSFNKVLIFVLPIILSPYFIHLGTKQGASSWCPYYISILVAGVFGALQGVQDKLDDPFDGMTEDDIKIETIDEWTFHNLENIVNRNFTIGRFHVSANIDQADAAKPRAPTLIHSDPIPIPTSPQATARNGGAFTNLRKKILQRSSRRKPNLSRRNSSFGHSRKPMDEVEHNFDPFSHPYAEVLEKIKGNARVQAKKGTGQVYVTDIFTDASKTDSSSSSLVSSEGSRKSVDEPNRPVSPSVVTFADYGDQIDNLESNTDKENSTGNHDTTAAATIHSNNKFQISKIDSPEPSIASTDSDVDSLSAASHQRLLPSSDDVKPTKVNPSPTSRFHLSSVPKTPISNHVELRQIPPSPLTLTTKVIKNNATITNDVSSSPVTDGNTGGELTEIVVVNPVVNGTVENVASA